MAPFQPMASGVQPRPATGYAQAVPQPRKKGGAGKVILIIFIVLFVIVGGGGAAAYYFLMKAGEAVSAALGDAGIDLKALTPDGGADKDLERALQRLLAPDAGVAVPTPPPIGTVPAVKEPPKGVTPTPAPPAATPKAGAKPPKSKIINELRDVKAPQPAPLPRPTPPPPPPPPTKTKLLRDLR
jgi:hypothetical protein